MRASPAASLAIVGWRLSQRSHDRADRRQAAILRQREPALVVDHQTLGLQMPQQRRAEVGRPLAVRFRRRESVAQVGRRIRRGTPPTPPAGSPPPGAAAPRQLPRPSSPWRRQARAGASSEATGPSSSPAAPAASASCDRPVSAHPEPPRLAPRSAARPLPAAPAGPVSSNSSMSITHRAQRLPDACVRRCGWPIAPGAKARTRPNRTGSMRFIGMSATPGFLRSEQRMEGCVEAGQIDHLAGDGRRRGSGSSAATARLGFRKRNMAHALERCAVLEPQGPRDLVDLGRGTTMVRHGLCHARCMPFPANRRAANNTARIQRPVAATCAAAAATGTPRCRFPVPAAPGRLERCSTVEDQRPDDVHVAQLQAPSPCTSRAAASITST